MSILKQHSHDGIAPGRPSHAHHGQPAGHPPGGVFAEGSGGGGAHHTHHAHMVADFRRRFWICLGITFPVLALAPMIQQWLGLREMLHFPGESFVAFGLATVIFFYGGAPFLKGFFDELRKRQPGMMTLVSVAITVAYVYSAAVVFGLPGAVFFWELATLIDIMLLGHWIEMRSVMGASAAPGVPRPIDALARPSPAARRGE